MKHKFAPGDKLVDKYNNNYTARIVGLKPRGYIINFSSPLGELSWTGHDLFYDYAWVEQHHIKCQDFAQALEEIVDDKDTEV